MGAWLLMGGGARAAGGGSPSLPFSRQLLVCIILAALRSCCVYLIPHIHICLMGMFHICKCKCAGWIPTAAVPHKDLARALYCCCSAGVAHAFKQLPSHTLLARNQEQ